MAKMAGPWIPLPEEVIFLLEQEVATSMRSYVLMLAYFTVEEITDTEGIWVAGRIHVTKHRIAQTVHKSRGHFDSHIWPRWIEIGLVEIKNGGVYLPLLYKKGSEILQPARIAEEIKELRTWQMKMQLKYAEMESKSAEMEETIQNLLTALEKAPKLDEITNEGRNVITMKLPRHEATFILISLRRSKDLNLRGQFADNRLLQKYRENPNSKVGER